MLTTAQINAVATLGAAIARINAREEKTIRNTRERYAQERGEAKANASPEALRLHGIDLDTDEDVRAWREAQSRVETPEPEPGPEPEPKRRGRE